MSNKILAVIPARWASSRLPGKPLEMIGDQSMIHRVYRSVSDCKEIDKVIVATDDERILNHCKTHSIEAMMTSADHPSGTDRVAEVADAYPNYQYVINVQGDEPFIANSQLASLISLLQTETVSIATQYAEIADEDSLFDFNIVKLVKNDHGKVMYFSRQAIPAQRDLPFREWMERTTYYRHIGLYGFDRSILLELVELPVGSLEQLEKLEQLRWLQNGYSIHAIETKESSMGIDTPEDLQKARDLVEE